MRPWSLSSPPASVAAGCGSSAPPKRSSKCAGRELRAGVRRVLEVLHEIGLQAPQGGAQPLGVDRDARARGMALERGAQVALGLLEALGPQAAARRGEVAQRVLEDRVGQLAAQHRLGVGREVLRAEQPLDEPLDRAAHPGLEARRRPHLARAQRAEHGRVAERRDRGGRLAPGRALGGQRGAQALALGRRQRALVTGRAERAAVDGRDRRRAGRRRRRRTASGRPAHPRRRRRARTARAGRWAATAPRRRGSARRRGPPRRAPVAAPRRH